MDGSLCCEQCNKTFEEGCDCCPDENIVVPDILKKLVGEQNKWKTFHQTLEVNIETLNAYGEYVDFVQIPEKQISLRLIIKKGVPNFIAAGTSIKKAS